MGEEQTKIPIHNGNPCDFPDFSSDYYLTMKALGKTDEQMSQLNKVDSQFFVKRIKAKDYKNELFELDTTDKLSESYKVIKYNNRKLIFIPRMALFSIIAKFEGTFTNDLFLRIYPRPTDPMFMKDLITCCKKHGKKYTTSLFSEMTTLTEESLIEVKGIDVIYEPISLQNISGENQDRPLDKEYDKYEELRKLLRLYNSGKQISLLVKYDSPKSFLTMLFKCYNSCQRAFNYNFPKLHFTIEKCLSTNKYEILAEQSIYFKVCSNPPRDIQILNRSNFWQRSEIEMSSKENILGSPTKEFTPKKVFLELTRVDNDQKGESFNTDEEKVIKKPWPKKEEASTMEDFCSSTVFFAEGDNEEKIKLGRSIFIDGEIASMSSFVIGCVLKSGKKVAFDVPEHLWPK